MSKPCHPSRGTPSRGRLPKSARTSFVPCPPLHSQKLVPHRRVAWRYEFPPQLPAMPLAGGAEADRAAAEAGVELVDRAHATDRARIVGTVEQSALYVVGRHEI